MEETSLFASLFLGVILIAAFAGITYFYHQSKERAALSGSSHRATAKNPEKIGRNEPCPCGSGKKYKSCCGKKK